MTANVTLREYIEIRLDAMEAAVIKAENAAEKRFEAINEMRAMVTDAALQYMPRKEFEAGFNGLSEKVDFLQKIVMPRGEYDIEHKALMDKVELIDKQYVPRSENSADHKLLFDKIDGLQRIVWIGIGILSTLQFLVGVFLLWRERQ